MNTLLAKGINVISNQNDGVGNSDRLLLWPFQKYEMLWRPTLIIPDWAVILSDL